MKRCGRPIDKRIFICPQCNKKRMSRPLDHCVSLKKRKFVDRNKQEIELLIDTCDFCQQKNYRKHFEPTKEDARNILKAMKDQVPTETSLEDLL